MKFLAEYTGVASQRKIIYDVSECSFNTEPSVSAINFDIVLNKLNLTVVSDDNIVIEVWGFSGYKEWIKSDYVVPNSKKGNLRVVDNLESGFSYRINKEDLPVYVNTKTGWVCIGNPETNGKAIEFISNCIAVLDDDKELVSLWLRPQSLPNI